MPWLKPRHQCQSSNFQTKKILLISDCWVVTCIHVVSGHASHYKVHLMFLTKDFNDIDLPKQILRPRPAIPGSVSEWVKNKVLRICDADPSTFGWRGRWVLRHLYWSPVDRPETPTSSRVIRQRVGRCKSDDISGEVQWPVHWCGRVDVWYGEAVSAEDDIGKHGAWRHVDEWQIADVDLVAARDAQETGDEKQQRGQFTAPCDRHHRTIAYLNILTDRQKLMIHTAYHRLTSATASVNVFELRRRRNSTSRNHFLLLPLSPRSRTSTARSENF